MILFSASTNLFYDTDIIPEPPSDAVVITVAEHQKMLDGQSAGKVISSTTQGKPRLVDPEPPTSEELAVVARAYRDNLLAFAALRIAPLQDAVDLGDVSEDESAQLTSWKQYRVAVNRVTAQPGFPAKIDWPVAPE